MARAKVSALWGAKRAPVSAEYSEASPLVSVRGVGCRIVSPRRKSSKNRPAAVLAGEEAAIRRSEDVGVDVVDDDPLDQHHGEEKDDRRNVDASGGRQEVADRPQEWLGHGEKQIPDRANEV